MKMKQKVTNKKKIDKHEEDISSENFSLRGRIFTGIITSTKMQKTAIVEWNRKIKISKYERHINKRKRIAVHVPETITVQKGDMVKVQETRPLSKTKHFVIIENVGFQKTHIIKEEAKDGANQGVHKKDDNTKPEQAEELKNVTN